jgi:hypothetical protein
MTLQVGSSRNRAAQGWVGPVTQGTISPPQMNDPSVPGGYTESTTPPPQQQPLQIEPDDQAPTQHPPGEPVTPPVNNNDPSTDL